MAGLDAINMLKLDIACSVYLKPCTETELMEREFCKNISLEFVQRLIMSLEKDALYYKGEVMYIKKSWAKDNLKGYELDFRSKKQKQLDGMTDFAKSVLGYK